MFDILGHLAHIFKNAKIINNYTTRKTDSTCIYCRWANCNISICLIESFLTLYKDIPESIPHTFSIFAPTKKKDYEIQNACTGFR